MVLVPQPSLVVVAVPGLLPIILMFCDIYGERRTASSTPGTGLVRCSSRYSESRSSKPVYGLSSGG